MRSWKALRVCTPPVLALLLAAGCSDAGGSGTPGDEAGSPGVPAPQSPPPESGAPGSDAPPESAEAVVVQFCTDGQAVFGRLSAALQDPDPTEVPGLLREASDAFDTVTAPPDIAPDFATLRTAYDELAAAAAPLDLGTPQGQAAFQDSFQTIAGPALPAQDALSAWTQANCPVG